MLADYMVADPRTTKLTVVGGGISWITAAQNAGQTVPFSVVAIATFAPAFVGQSPAVELLLEDQHGRLVPLPGATGAQGQPQYIRVGISNPLPAAAFPTQRIPQDAVRPRVQILLNFQNGLPLERGHRYTWRVKIDQETRDEWTEWLYVSDPAPGAVVG
ncbi:hypothetical protein [Mycobacterium sp.]|uniref:hypothetical protein n=1 Tax=Mycobacterium sp. TaxID=1785 RepID=UPI003C720970